MCFVSLLTGFIFQYVTHNWGSSKALPQARKFHPCGVQDLGIQPREKLGEPGKRQDDASTLHPRLKRDDKARRAKDHSDGGETRLSSLVEPLVWGVSQAFVFRFSPPLIRKRQSAFELGEGRLVLFLAASTIIEGLRFAPNPSL